jgi:hypothetical protein
MDEPRDATDNAPMETIVCGMCQQRVPIHQTRAISGRPLCLGCLTAWYGEDDDD